MEPADASAAEAALREAREEVGLDADAAGVEVIGDLESFVIPVSSFRVHPVLAVAARRPEVVPDPREVAAVLEVPLRTFLPDAPIEQVQSDREGRRFRYGAYPFRHYRIWGATARILGQLGAIVEPGMGAPARR